MEIGNTWNGLARRLRKLEHLGRESLSFCTDKQSFLLKERVPKTEILLNKQVRKRIYKLERERERVRREPAKLDLESGEGAYMGERVGL